MADPFEVRMRFTAQLQHLNASVNSAQKAALYAVRHQDMDEDLHSCILEQLGQNSMNNRANIMFFIEQLCDVAQRENRLDFIRMIQRDILSIIDLAAPTDGSGAANVKVVRRVLGGLQDKKVLSPETVVELEDCLKDRDTNGAHPTSSPVTGRDSSKQQTPSMQRSNGTRLDKRQIEQRIEEDRERHKRLRESIWAVNSEENKEFERLWEDTSDIGEDDFINAEEDAYERQRAVRELEYSLPPAVPLVAK